MVFVYSIDLRLISNCVGGAASQQHPAESVLQLMFLVNHPCATISLLNHNAHHTIMVWLQFSGGYCVKHLCFELKLLK